jgi:uncharacterized protein Yka (UPF0111/DUF47 family)
MFEIADAIKTIAAEATSLSDNIPNFTDPPTATQLETIQGYIDSIQHAIRRLQVLKDKAPLTALAS